MKNATPPKYFLRSDNTDADIYTFEMFARILILKLIAKYLTDNPADTIVLERDLTISESKQYAGRQIIDFFKLNTKGVVCKIVTKGNKEYLKIIKI